MPIGGVASKRVCACSLGSRLAVTQIIASFDGYVAKVILTRSPRRDVYLVPLPAVVVVGKFSPGTEGLKVMI